MDDSKIHDLTQGKHKKLDEIERSLEDALNDLKMEKVRGYSRAPRFETEVRVTPQMESE